MIDGRHMDSDYCRTRRGNGGSGAGTLGVRRPESSVATPAGKAMMQPKYRRSKAKTRRPASFCRLTLDGYFKDRRAWSHNQARMRGRHVTEAGPVCRGQSARSSIACSKSGGWCRLCPLRHS